MRLALVLLLTTGCIGGSQVRFARNLDLALGSDGTFEPEVSDLDGSARWEVTGTAEPVDDDATFDLAGNAEGDGTVVQIRDDDGQRYWLFAAVREDGAQSPTDLAPVTSGAVTLRFQEDRGWSIDHAAVLVDEQGALFAGEEGWAARLDDEALADLSVDPGTPYGIVRHADCGPQHPVELDVTDASGTRGLKIRDIAIVVPAEGAPSATIENLGAWTYGDRVRCTDVWGPSPWVLTR